MPFLSLLFKKKRSKNPQKKLYYQLKELLLEHEITSQAVENSTIFERSFKWSITNIAVAHLAKLTGIPWKLNAPFKRELLFGVGAFKNMESSMQYIGNTICFFNDGYFKEFGCYSQNELFLLAGDIELKHQRI
ncbi:hypothetical protein [Xanthovirga aplysinae]|uniref:hypothetical protein n=1 Tax=Xanthovirga aplysinae TaxID=2529853 RepID=UPI0012BC4DFE|nr:hypothetical protein [Xanthovirga aplysinae]MTI30400.1 hypothetical protein [Xanthovirga aplysinae]